MDKKQMIMGEKIKIVDWNWFLFSLLVNSAVLAMELKVIAILHALFSKSLFIILPLLFLKKVNRFKSFIFPRCFSHKRLQA